MDIFKRKPVEGDLITFAQYARSSSLYIGRVIGFSKTGNPRIVRIDPKTMEEKTAYIKVVITDYCIINKI